MDNRIIAKNGKSNTIKFDLSSINSWEDFKTKNNKGDLKCDVIAETSGDGILVVGTPLNKATLLNDTAENLYNADTVSKALERGTTVRELTVGTNWVADENIVKQEILAPWSKATFSAVFGLKVGADIEGDREQFAKILEDGLIFEDGKITVKAIEPTEKEITIRVKGV